MHHLRVYDKNEPQRLSSYNINKLMWYNKQICFFIVKARLSLESQLKRLTCLLTAGLRLNLLWSGILAALFHLHI